MVEKYIAKPVDALVIDELRQVVEKCENEFKKEITLNEARILLDDLNKKLSRLIDFRNKSIEETIPPEVLDKAMVSASTSGCNYKFHIQIDSNVEKLIEKAIDLYNDYEKLL